LSLTFLHIDGSSTLLTRCGALLLLLLLALPAMSTAAGNAGAVAAAVEKPVLTLLPPTVSLVLPD